MYAKLEPWWMLRGWSDLPWAASNRQTGQFLRLTEDAWHVAQSCDGHTDFSSPAFLPRHIAWLDKFIAHGVATECRAGESLDRLQEYRQADTPFIRSIHWAITGNCNMKCRHCFMEAPSRRYGQPSLGTLLGFIEQFERANLLEVSLTGGEPLLRDDLLEIVDALSAKGIRLTEIATNGTLLATELLDAIKQRGHRPDIKISFDGVGAHDGLRGTRGSEGRVIGAIRRAVDAGLLVAVSTTLDRENLDALVPTYELMKSLKVPVWLIGRPQTTGDWCGGVAAASTEEMARACMDVLRRWVADGKPLFVMLERFFSGRTGPPTPSCHTRERYQAESYECEALRGKAYLLPDGTLLPCVGYTATSIHNRMPNLLRDDLSAAWRTSELRRLIEMRKDQVLAHNPECVACNMFATCGAGCRAYALSEAGAHLAKDPLACALYKGGYREQFAATAAMIEKGNGTALCKN